MQAVGQQGTFTLNSNGQTTVQAAAATQLDEILSLLNTQVGNNYMFSGSAANQPSVASTDDILNGNGAQAGLTQVITERQQADLGTGTAGWWSAARDRPCRSPRISRLAVRLQARGRDLEPDRRDRDRPTGSPPIDLGRSRLQSE